MTDNADEQIVNFQIAKRQREKGDLYRAVGRKNRPRSACRHHDIETDSQRRLLHCTACDTWIDPFEWIDAIAKRNEYIEWQRNNLAREVKALTEEVAQLKADRNKHKSALRRAKKNHS
jgi:hypothetical protein